jgi:lipopolysaccharide/colanic/teichoic acid biosynthesis glycosyltransferase
MNYRNSIKPFFDFLFAFLLLLLLSPIIFIVIVVLAVVNKGSVLFIQLRPGLKGRPFRIVKFKTMRDVFDQDGNPLSDDLRLTFVGKIIRKFSLDEILQLVNVLKGDMSIIGPRPLLMKYLPLYNDIQMKRHDVLPGISGWAQVNGRNNISWKKKFEYDLEYIKRQSFAFDCRIIFMTLLRVFLGSGVSQEGSKTTAEFSGKDD